MVSPNPSLFIRVQFKCLHHFKPRNIISFFNVRFSSLVKDYPSIDGDFLAVWLFDEFKLYVFYDETTIELSDVFSKPKHLRHQVVISCLPF